MTIQEFKRLKPGDVVFVLAELPDGSETVSPAEIISIRSDPIGTPGEVHGAELAPIQCEPVIRPESFPKFAGADMVFPLAVYAFRAIEIRMAEHIAGLELKLRHFRENQSRFNWDTAKKSDAWK